MLWMSIFFALNLVKANAPYILELMEYLVWRGMMECVLFLFNNVVIWWAFRGVILCYPLANLYSCEEISTLVVIEANLIRWFHVLYWGYIIT